MVGPDGKGRRVDTQPQPSALVAGSSTLRAAFLCRGGRTALDRVYEAGALRLRQPRGAACEAILVNTGGGVVGGDRLSLDISAGADAAVVLTSVAAEKVYGSAGATSTIATRLQLEAGATLDWLPQETILFDGVRLDRRFDIDMATDARLVAAEILVFGRLAKGETTIHGTLRDSWRVRRDGRLVFADESRLDGTIGAELDRPAVAGGARAAALLLVVAPDAARHLDPLRAALESFLPDVEAGASAQDGLLIARCLARKPERLRDAMMAALAVVRGRAAPRSWG